MLSPTLSRRPPSGLKETSGKSRFFLLSRAAGSFPVLVSHALTVWFRPGSGGQPAIWTERQLPEHRQSHRSVLQTFSPVFGSRRIAAPSSSAVSQLAAIRAVGDILERLRGDLPGSMAPARKQHAICSPCMELAVAVQPRPGLYAASTWLVCPRSERRRSRPALPVRHPAIQLERVQRSFSVDAACSASRCCAPGRSPGC